jgi:hypothetical protein
MTGLLPDVVLDRCDKAGFAVAFRQHLDEIEELCVKELIGRRHDWVRGDVVREFLVKARSGGHDRYLWLLWILVLCDAVGPTDGGQPATSG